MGRRKYHFSLEVDAGAGDKIVARPHKIVARPHSPSSPHSSSSPRLNMFYYCTRSYFGTDGGQEE